MPPAVAIAGAAVVGAGATVIAGNKAAKASKNAAAANNALDAQIYGENKAALAPYQTQGTSANTAIGALLGLSPSGASAQTAAFDNFRKSAGYDFRLQEGQKAVTAALGKSGYLDSGGAKRALTSYGQNIGSDEFARYYGALTGQQGVGLTAASAQAGVSQNYAGAVSANNNAAANASGNAALSTANGINGALSSGLSAYALNAGMKSSYGSGGGLPPLVMS